MSSASGSRIAAAGDMAGSHRPSRTPASLSAPPLSHRRAPTLHCRTSNTRGSPPPHPVPLGRGASGPCWRAIETTLLCSRGRTLTFGVFHPLSASAAPSFCRWCETGGQSARGGTQRASSTRPRPTDTDVDIHLQHRRRQGSQGLGARLGMHLATASSAQDGPLGCQLPVQARRRQAEMPALQH